MLDLFIFYLYNIKQTNNKTISINNNNQITINKQ